MKRIPVFLGTVFFAIGACILLYDSYFILTYGVDVNDVAGVTDDGLLIDWPTGLRPAFAVPAFIYTIGLWLFAAICCAAWPEVGHRYSGREWRGTE